MLTWPERENAELEEYQCLADETVEVERTHDLSGWPYISKAVVRGTMSIETDIMQERIVNNGIMGEEGLYRY